MDNNMSTTEFEDLSLTEDPMEEWLFLSSESASPPSPSVSREEQPEDTTKLKSKLLSAWNSFRYVSAWSLKQKSKFNKSSPVIMLGKTYVLTHPGDREHFRRSFSSLLWLTYRRGFPPLPGCGLSTDSGWGCMLRTGQMLLAQGLLLHLMPPDWSWTSNLHSVKDDIDLQDSHASASSDQSQRNGKLSRQLSLGSLLDRPMVATHRRMVTWFADRPSAPFGIHKLVDLGKSSGKKAGDWYGPSIVAHILRKALNKSPDLSKLSVYVAQDCTVYKEDVSSLCEWPGSDSATFWTSVIILVPVRLGGQELNPNYIPFVKKLLGLHSCIGIIGGKPKHSLFFVGYQDNYLLYLDPHVCQPSVDVSKGNFPLESFHCKHPKKIPFSRMDPSCTIGFYAKDPTDFETLCKDVTEALFTSKDTYPIFIFEEGPGPQEETITVSTDLTYIQRKSQRKRLLTSSSMDEFVLL
ncbi:cysteine protease atg4da [Eucyclogobius newberryi]|uniref:cysteine protease atg4da n=1 Tax=Eucyclogobius newberryi TaxID=166745 RepID=UPI003B596AF5